MNIFEAIFLGFVQGVAEFLPISSSGHLAIFEKLFGLDEVGLAFDLMLHLGTLLAVFIVYWKDIWELICEGVLLVLDACKNIGRFFKKKSGNQDVTYIQVVNTPYRRFVMLVIVSTIPTGVLGIVFKKIFDMDSPSLYIPGIALLITGCMLSLIDQIKVGKKNEETMTYKDATVLGVAQGIATLPGISRSGTTLTVGLLCGLERDYAVKYSFIMSIPAILGANLLEVKDLFDPDNSISGGEFFNYIVGTIIAAIVGYACIKGMLYLVKKQKMVFFSVYCLCAGVFALIANFFV